MPVTISEYECGNLRKTALPYVVIVADLNCYLEAVDWCETNLGRRFSHRVSGGFQESIGMITRPNARWDEVGQGCFWFACKGDAMYVKLKWEGGECRE